VGWIIFKKCTVLNKTFILIAETCLKKLLVRGISKTNVRKKMVEKELFGKF
jgi:hypothetical protein